MSAPYPGDPANEPALPTHPNTPGYGNVPTMPGTIVAAPRRSHRGLWIALASIVALLVILGGAGAYLFMQYTAPGLAATQFCSDLKAGTYTDAYHLLSNGLAAQFTQEEFALGAQVLDAAEGKVTACASSGYHYTLFASSASVTATLTRTQTHTGMVQLRNESGAWKISALDTSLLGANLGALKVAAAFCAALQAKDYTTAFGLLDPASLQGGTQATVTAILQAQDVIDGPITSCKLVTIASGNTDTTTTLTVSVVRAIRGTNQGQMTLTASDTTWKVSVLSTGLFGTDVRPLLVATQLCTDLTSGDVASAYQALTSSALKATVTQADFEAFFKLNPGETYAGCTPNLATYTLQGTTATFDTSLNITINGSTVGVPVTLTFVLENGVWLLNAARVKG